MSNKDIEELEVEIELDDEIIESIASKVEDLIHDVFCVELEGREEGYLEFIHVLVSVAAQVCLDMGMDKEVFMDLSDFIFEESTKFLQEEEGVEIDISRLN